MKKTASGEDRWHTSELTAEKKGWIVRPDPVGPVGRLLVHCHRLLSEVAVCDHLNKAEQWLRFLPLGALHTLSSRRTPPGSLSPSSVRSSCLWSPKQGRTMIEIFAARSAAYPVRPVGRLLVHCHRLLSEVAVCGPEQGRTMIEIFAARGAAYLVCPVKSLLVHLPVLSSSLWTKLWLRFFAETPPATTACNC